MSAAASPSAAAAPSAAAPSRPQLLSTPVTASARTFLTEQTGAVCKQTRAAKIFWNESVAKPTNMVARGAITETDDCSARGPLRLSIRLLESRGAHHRSIRRVCSHASLMRPRLHALCGLSCCCLRVDVGAQWSVVRQQYPLQIIGGVTAAALALSMPCQSQTDAVAQLFETECMSRLMRARPCFARPVGDCNRAVRDARGTNCLDLSFESRVHCVVLGCLHCAVGRRALFRNTLGALLFSSMSVAPAATIGTLALMRDRAMLSAGIHTPAHVVVQSQPQTQTNKLQ